MVNFSKVDVGSEDQIQHSLLLWFQERKEASAAKFSACLLGTSQGKGFFIL